MCTDLTSCPVSGHPPSHSTALSQFPSPSLTFSPIHLSSSVDDGKLISICFAAISAAAALQPWRRRRQPVGLSLPPSPACLLCCQRAPARGPGTRCSPCLARVFPLLATLLGKCVLGTLLLAIFSTQSELFF